MANQNPTGERVRIKTKYAEIVRKIAAIRSENFIDALYHIIDFYWQYHKGNISHLPITPNKSTSELKVRNLDSNEDIDMSDFE